MDPSRYYTSIDFNNFNSKEYFKYYDYVSEFNSNEECMEEYNKKFRNKKDKLDLGRGERKYNFIIYNFRDIRSNDLIKYFLVSEEIIIDDEVKILFPYCRCLKCTTPGIGSFFMCSCCFGCINSPFPSQEIIGETRKYMLEGRTPGKKKMENIIHHLNINFVIFILSIAIIFMTLFIK